MTKLVLVTQILYYKIVRLAVAGIPLPTDRVFDGKDITAVLEGTSPSPHEFLFFYRQFNVSVLPGVPAVVLPRPQVAAVKHGNWKAHFATASARGPDLRVVHDPPLVFQVASDPAERWPVYAMPTSTKKEKRKNITFGDHFRAHFEARHTALCDMT